MHRQSIILPSSIDDFVVRVTRYGGMAVTRGPGARTRTRIVNWSNIENKL